MAERVKIKPEEARAAAERKRGKAQEIEDLLDIQRNDVNSYSSFWDGAAFDRYIQRYQELEVSYREIPRDLRNQAAELDEIARRKEEADRLAALGLLSGEALNARPGIGGFYSDDLNTNIWGRSVVSPNDVAGIPMACAMGGDPINLATGNFVYFKEDIVIPGQFPIMFKRFYNAIGDSNSALGASWTHNFNIRLADRNTAVSIEFDDGHFESYKKLEDGSYTSPLDHNKALEKSDDGYILTLPSKEKYFFNDAGQLQFVADPNGNRMELSYKNDLLIHVENPCGSLSFVYNENRYLTQVSDHSGRKVELEYKDNRLVKAVHPSGAVFSYDYNQKGLLSKITNPVGINSICNQYDENNRTISQSFADGGTYALDYDDEKLSTTVTEQNGNKIKYLRDKNFRTTKIVYDGSNERFGYDENNNRTLYIDRNCHIHKFSYDDHKNLVKFIDPMGSSINIKYNEFNRPVEVIGLNDGVSTIEYDPQGNIVKIVDPLQREMQFANNSQGLASRFILPDASETSVVHDERGNIAAIIDSDGNQTQFEYDSLNRVVKTVNAEGESTLFEHNAKGDITKVTNAVVDSIHYD